MVKGDDRDAGAKLLCIKIKVWEWRAILGTDRFPVCLSLVFSGKKADRQKK